MANKQQTENAIWAVRAASEALAEQDRRVEPEEVADAAKKAYESAQRNS